MSRCNYRFKSGLQCCLDEDHEGDHDYSLKEWNEVVCGGYTCISPCTFSKEELDRIDSSKWKFKKGIAERYGKNKVSSN